MKIKNEALTEVTNEDINNGHFEVPDSVTSIGDSAFYRCTSLTSITIPNSVTSIGSCAFCDCESLTSITIPNSVTAIGYSAFYRCKSLTSITIPNSVTAIGYDAFAYCKSLTSITIPDSVTAIGNYAFAYCTSLTSITIPNSVTSIGSCAFCDCESLTSVTIGDKVHNVKCIDGYCMEILSPTKQIDDCEVYHAKYFDSNNHKTCYIAEKDERTAHGETIREAMLDVRFKIQQEDADVSEIVANVKAKGTVNAYDYRLLTGACRPGTQGFMDEKGYTWEDEIPIDRAIEETRGWHRADLFEKSLKD